MSAVILVVDDETPIRELLATVLEESGHRVVQAAHGEQALVAAERERPDLVLCDVMMPVMTGTEFCRRIKARYNVPVILMSAAGNPIRLDIGNADDFLPKPFDLRLVDDIVARHL